MTYSVFSFKLVTSFSTFSHFFRSGKNDKSLWVSSIFLRILNINFEKISFITFFIIKFYEVFVKLKSISYSFNILLEAFMTLSNHTNCLHPNILNMSILYFYHNISYICYSLLHLDEYFHPLIPFSTIINGWQRN